MWADYTGKLVTYTNLSAGQSFTADTFRNHIWVFTDGPGNCIETYLVRTGETRFNIAAPNRVGGPRND